MTTGVARKGSSGRVRSGADAENVARVLGADGESQHGTATPDSRSRKFWAWFASVHPARAKSEAVDPAVPHPVPVGLPAGVAELPVRRVRAPIGGERIARGYAITGAGRRKAPPAAIRRDVLDTQRDRCLYCGHQFGTIIRRGTRTLSLRLNWDHFIPYSYGLTNAGNNWVAACHVCNGIKSNRMFETVSRAKQYILTRWVEKGYDLTPVLTYAEISRATRRAA